MTQDPWTRVDDYIADLFMPGDTSLDAAREASAAAGLPAISVSPPHGKLLYLLACIQGARSILEVGTLGGYSTIWLARALPEGGRLVTLELSPATPRSPAPTSIAPACSTRSTSASARPAMRCGA